MTTPNNGHDIQSAADRARLDALLASYGRNPLRWPEADRLRFAALVRAPQLLPVEAAAAAADLDRLLDLAGPRAVPEPAGARARLLQRVATEPQLASDVTAPPPLSGLRGLFVAGMMAASIVIGAFVGLDTNAGAALADSLQPQSATEEVLDLVLADPDDDGGVL